MNTQLHGASPCIASRAWEGPGPAFKITNQFPKLLQGLHWVRLLTNPFFPQAGLTASTVTISATIVPVPISFFLFVPSPGDLGRGRAQMAIPWGTCEAVTPWWSKQAHVPQLLMFINVWLPWLPSFIKIELPTLTAITWNVVIERPEGFPGRGWCLWSFLPES